MAAIYAYKKGEHFLLVDHKKTEHISEKEVTKREDIVKVLFKKKITTLTLKQLHKIKKKNRIIQVSVHRKKKDFRCRQFSLVVVLMTIHSSVIPC